MFCLKVWLSTVLLSNQITLMVEKISAFPKRVNHRFLKSRTFLLYTNRKKKSVFTKLRKSICLVRANNQKKKKLRSFFHQTQRESVLFFREMGAPTSGFEPVVAAQRPRHLVVTNQLPLDRASELRYRIPSICLVGNYKYGLSCDVCVTPPRAHH